MLNQYLDQFKGIKKERKRAFLEKKLRVNGVIYSMHEFIEKHHQYGASIDKRLYSTRKINLEYKKLSNPVLTYFIYIDEKERDAIEIKKIGYDYYKFIINQNFLEWFEDEIEKERERRKEAFLDLLDDTLEELEG